MKMFITRAEILLLIKFSFSPGLSAVASLAVLSSFTFSVSVITQIIYKSNSIAKFQMNSRRGDNSSLFDDLTLCASFMEMMAIHFQVPKRLFSFFFVLYKSSSIFTLGNRLSPILSLFYRRFHVFLRNSYLHLSLFCRESLISVSCFGFISHSTRISNKTSFLCKRLVVKN